MRIEYINKYLVKTTASLHATIIRYLFFVLLKLAAGLYRLVDALISARDKWAGKNLDTCTCETRNTTTEHNGSANKN